MAYWGDTKAPCPVCGQVVSNRGFAQWSHLRGKYHKAAKAVADEGQDDCDV